MELAFAGWSGVFIMAVYGLIMLGIGVSVYLRNKGLHQSMDEYFLGGRQLGVMVLFFTLYATQYSGNTIVGYAPNAYRLGFEWVQSIPFMILVITGYLLFAPRLYVLSKRHRFITPSDWLEARFQSKAVTLVGTLLMLYGLGNYLLEQLVAIGHGVAGLTGGTIPYQAAVLFFIIVMLIYGWLGGMRSVAYTDAMQGIALFVGIVLMLVGTMVYFGGLPEASDYMATYAPEKLGVPTGERNLSWISMLILVGIGAAVYPHAVQRIFSAKSEKTLKKSLRNMAWMPFITTGLVMLVGLIGVKAFPGLSVQESEQLVGMIASAIANENLFFYWAMILLFGGVVAAILSTADSVLLSFSSMVSRDIYERLINPAASERTKVMVGKVVGVVMVFILLMIAWYPPATLYEIFILKFEVLIQVAPAFILGLYWNRLHKHAVLLGMLVGAGIAGYMTLAHVENPLGIHNGLWGLMVNLLICIGGSYLFSSSVQEQQSSREILSIDAAPAGKRLEG